MEENVVRNQPAAEVKSLKSLLQYQEGAIVSRILLKNPAGTVTLFAFGKGERSERAHRPIQRPGDRRRGRSRYSNLREKLPAARGREHNHAGE
jgi:hypothetical protein